jgi:hypothetical protein
VTDAVGSARALTAAETIALATKFQQPLAFERVNTTESVFTRTLSTCVYSLAHTICTVRRTVFTDLHSEGQPHTFTRTGTFSKTNFVYLLCFRNIIASTPPHDPFNARWTFSLYGTLVKQLADSGSRA